MLCETIATFFEPLAAQERDGGGEPLGRLGEERRVVVAFRVGREHRHLHRERGVALLGELAAQRVDEAPVRVQAEAVHDDHAGGGLGVRRVDRQELAAGLERELDRVADQDRRRDLVRPALLARVVGLRERGAWREQRSHASASARIQRMPRIM